METTVLYQVLVKFLRDEGLIPHLEELKIKHDELNALILDIIERLYKAQNKLIK